MNVRPPLRLQFGKVFHRPRVVPEEVHPADAVLLIDVVIHLADRVVDRDVVGESVWDVDVWIVVRREAGSVAGNRGAGERAARQLANWQD